jgi:hypothetical protein
MIEDPGSFSGIVISQKPLLGPDAKNLTSLANFIKTEARLFKVPERSTILDNWDKASCLF